MKNIIDRLTNVGATNDTINFILKMLALFMFIVGMGIIAIMIVESVRDQTINPAFIAILVVIVTIVSGLLTVSSTTAHINGTAAQSAQLASVAQSTNAEQLTSIIEKVLAASLTAQKQADTHATDIVSAASTIPTTPGVSTIATQENTAATIDNTNEMIKKELHNG